MHFGKNLKYLIKKNGMTGGELAEKLNVGQSAVSSYVTGIAFPKVESLILLRDTFNIDIDSLLFTDLTIRLNITNELIEKAVKEPQEPYIKSKKEYEVIKMYEPITNTEGGLLESLIKRIEVLESEVRILKHK